jgi:tetratricopeptide (TPR) repeat protein
MGIWINIDNPFLDTMALLLLIPFMALGIYALRRRFVNHDDWGLARQSAFLIVALLIAALEMHTLRAELLDNPVYLIFASLGMLAATMALYGHIAVSFLSKLMVDVFFPGGDRAANQPRFGPAEAMERMGDYQGALNEYHVLARIFPGRPEILARIGSAQDALRSYEEAAHWFQRALDGEKDSHAATALLWRVVDLLENRQQLPNLAAQACEEFLERFPDCADALLVRARMQLLKEKHASPAEPLSAVDRPRLTRLHDEPIQPQSRER